MNSDRRETINFKGSYPWAVRGSSAVATPKRYVLLSSSYFMYTYTVLFSENTEFTPNLLSTADSCPGVLYKRLFLGTLSCVACLLPRSEASYSGVSKMTNPRMTWFVSVSMTAFGKRVFAFAGHPPKRTAFWKDFWNLCSLCMNVYLIFFVYNHVLQKELPPPHHACMFLFYLGEKGVERTRRASGKGSFSPLFSFSYSRTYSSPFSL